MKDGSKYKAILFDADGTLIDSVDAHVASFIDLAESLGLGPIDVRKYIGLPFGDIIRIIFGDKWINRVEELQEKRKNIFMEKYFDKVKPLIPLDIIKELKKRYMLGVVTSGGHVTLSLLNKFGYADLMDVIITPRGRAKPCPDPLLEAVKLVGEPALYVGDTIYDEAAALAAGLDFVYVRDFIKKWNHLV